MCTNRAPDHTILILIFTNFTGMQPHTHGRIQFLNVVGGDPPPPPITHNPQ